jgi:hypothetical protein
METGLAIITAMIFMLALVFSAVTLDETIGGILKALHPNIEFKFPVGYAVLAIITWTVFYFINIITP